MSYAAVSCADKCRVILASGGKAGLALGIVGVEARTARGSKPRAPKAAKPHRGSSRPEAFAASQPDGLGLGHATAPGPRGVRNPALMSGQAPSGFLEAGGLCRFSARRPWPRAPPPAPGPRAVRNPARSAAKPLPGCRPKAFAAPQPDGLGLGHAPPRRRSRAGPRRAGLKPRAEKRPSPSGAGASDATYPDGFGLGEPFPGEPSCDSPSRSSNGTTVPAP